MTDEGNVFENHNNVSSFVLFYFFDKQFVFFFLILQMDEHKQPLICLCPDEKRT